MTSANESVSFTVEGQPVPKGRPRFFRGVAITPRRTRDYERLVRSVAALHCARWRRDGLYRVTAVFTGASPVADIDNLAKALLDGIQGHAFDDDKQVSELFLVRNHAKGEPRVDVTIERIGDMPAKRTRRRRTA